MAFCSETPFIVSSAFLGLLLYQHMSTQIMYIMYGRICYALDGVESSVNEELDVAFGETRNALQFPQ